MRSKTYICELCITNLIRAVSEDEAIREAAERIANMNESELEDYIIAQEEHED